MHTLIIPTYNRPAMLQSLLAHLAKSELRAIILDSSLPAAQASNEQFIKPFAQFRHCRFPTEISGGDKFGWGLEQIETPYASFLADDDFLFVDAVPKCVELLEKNCDAIAAHGIYLNFGYQKTAPHTIALSLEYGGASIQADSAGERLVQLLSNYESPMYAVYRTKVMQEVFSKIPAIKELGYAEMFQAVASVLKGKILRIPEAYGARRDCPYAELNRKHADPWTWMGEDPMGLFQAYLPYRQAVLDWWQSCDETYDPEQTPKWCDAAHYLYLHTHVGPKQLYRYNFKLPYPAESNSLSTSNQASPPGLQDRLTRVLRERPWRHPVYSLARLFRKVADKVVKISEQRAATLPVNPMSIRADCPIQLADNLKSRADFPWLPQAAEGIRDFIKLNLATSKLAA